MSFAHRKNEYNNKYLSKERTIVYCSPFFIFRRENEWRKIIVNNKKLDIMSLIHYNTITYHRYDRKELKWQGIEIRKKQEGKY